MWIEQDCPEPIGMMLFRDSWTNLFEEKKKPGRMTWTLGFWKHGEIPMHYGLFRSYQRTCNAWHSCFCWISWPMPNDDSWQVAVWWIWVGQEWCQPVVNYLCCWGAHVIQHLEEPDLANGNFAGGWSSCMRRLGMAGASEAWGIFVYVAPSAPISSGYLEILSFLVVRGCLIVFWYPRLWWEEEGSCYNAQYWLLISSRTHGGIPDSRSLSGPFPLSLITRQLLSFDR